MRTLKYKISRRSREILYLSFIRPILEYDNVLFEGCGVSNQIKLNRVQYEAAKLVTGAMHGTSSNALLVDLVWESLQARQERHKPLPFYKLLNDCSQHLEDIQPEFIMTSHWCRFGFAEVRWQVAQW